MRTLLAPTRSHNRWNKETRLPFHSLGLVLPLSLLELSFGTIENDMLNVLLLYPPKKKSARDYDAFLDEYESSNDYHGDSEENFSLSRSYSDFDDVGDSEDDESDEEEDGDNDERKEEKDSM